MLDLHAAAARITLAHGPSRDLDADIYEALGYQVKRAPEHNGYQRTKGWAYLVDSRWLAMGRLSFSMDDVLHLLDQVLPDHGVTVDRTSVVSATIWDRDSDGHFVSGKETYQVEAATMPLAVLLATVRMLIAKGAK